jgi:hypothetical protein
VEALCGGWDGVLLPWWGPGGPVPGVIFGFLTGGSDCFGVSAVGLVGLDGVGSEKYHGRFFGGGR